MNPLYPSKKELRVRRLIGALFALLFLLGIVLFMPERCSGQPRDYYRYQRAIKAEFYSAFGPAQDPGHIAAQLQQESYFKTDARSSAGAAGMAQFMPQTRDWVITLFPSLRGYEGDARTNAAWSIRACVLYDKFLYDRVTGVWDDVFFSYNAGLGWLRKERAAGRCLRSAQSCSETRSYVARISHFFEAYYRLR
jgi:soluble lytic murein transglycosylase-like protein